ncbi:MAG: metallophosphoesterase [bacterium]
MTSKKEWFSLRVLSRCLILCLLVFIWPLSAQAQSWKFIAYGDTRSNDARHREVLQSIMNNTPDYRFMINVGDVVQDGTSTSQWITWQNACNDILGGTGQDQVPPKYMATPGNHDATETAAGLANWNTYLPGQVQQYGNEGKFFVFDYENARFVILDSDKSPMSGAQFTMLLDAIQNNPKTWLFTIWHHPIFDFGPKRYEGQIHNLWGIPLYQYGCDIMFMGHAHYYVRTKKLGLNGEMNPPLDLETGTVQIVTGNGGAPLYSLDPNHDGNGYMVESYLEDYGYCELTVDGDTLHLRHILRDGTVFDKAVYTPNPKPGTTAVNETIAGNTLPAGYHLLQNYPNPFNPQTTIQFDLPTSGNVILEIFNISGSVVNTLFAGYLTEGTHKLNWPGVNSAGLQLPSGAYFYRIRTDTFEKTMKMIKLQ